MDRLSQMVHEFIAFKEGAFAYPAAMRSERDDWGSAICLLGGRSIFLFSEFMLLTA
jgi:hypothetical protein